MGELLDRVKLSKLVYGNGDVESFKNNSMFLYESLGNSNKMIVGTSVREIQTGGFYFLHYRDDSNWMKYSPVFTVSHKQFGNMIVLMAVNFNFIPVEVRVTMFDKFMTEEDFERDRLLAVDYEGMYRELLKWGFEYALVEYNVAQIAMVHKVSAVAVPRFLNSQHPINKYDPLNLYGIWRAKLGDRAKRHDEMSAAMLKDFYEIEKDISEEFDVLREHILRLQRSYEKYGK
jgi:hypothetical protein